MQPQLKALFLVILFGFTNLNGSITFLESHTLIDLLLDRVIDLRFVQFCIFLYNLISISIWFISSRTLHFWLLLLYSLLNLHGGSILAGGTPLNFEKPVLRRGLWTYGSHKRFHKMIPTKTVFIWTLLSQMHVPLCFLIIYDLYVYNTLCCCSLLRKQWIRISRGLPTTSTQFWSCSSASSMRGATHACGPLLSSCNTTWWSSPSTTGSTHSATWVLRMPPRRATTASSTSALSLC